MFNAFSFQRMLCCCSTSLLLYAAAAHADDIFVEEHTQAAIQAALDQVSPPGKVILQAGAYHLDQRDSNGRPIPLRIPRNDITLQGEVSNLPTTLYRTIEDEVLDEGWDPNHSHLVPLVRSTGNARVRITGIRFEGTSRLDDNGQETSKGPEVGVYLENAEDFRVDYCFFTHTGFAGVRTDGFSNGVVDHSTFVDNFKRPINTDGYGVAVYGIDVLEGEPFGSARATFIEDCFFQKCRHAAAANKGGRYVFRNNHVIENEIAHAVDAHGMEYGSDAGTEWIDVHDNLIEDPTPVCSPPNSPACFAVHIRGGQGVVWSNQFLHYNQGIHLSWDTDAGTGPVYIYDNTLLINEGSHSRCSHDPTSPMFCAVGTHGTPTWELSPPDNYVPFPYPHPLVTDASPRTGALHVTPASRVAFPRSDL